MNVDRFITIIALGIAEVGLCMSLTNNRYILFGNFIGTCIIVVILYKIERALRDSQGEFLSKCAFYLSKTKDKFVIKYEEARYRYVTKNEMEYSKSVDIVSKVNNLDRIEEKYSWSSYGKNVKVEPMRVEHEINYLAAQNVWTRFEILFNKRLAKKELINTGFKVNGLVDELGIAKPFLSLSTYWKIKERKMVVIIPQNLEPQNGRFEIYLGGQAGKVLKSEPLEYDRTIGGYQKTIKYPRTGRTYSIVWEWKSSS